MKPKLNTIYKMTINFNLQNPETELYIIIGKLTRTKQINCKDCDYALKIIKIVKDHNNFINTFTSKQKFLLDIRLSWIKKIQPITKNELMVYMI